MVAVGGRVRVQYAATDLGDHLVGELHDVEGVGGDLAVRQGRAARPCGSRCSRLLKSITTTWAAQHIIGKSSDPGLQELPNVKQRSLFGDVHRKNSTRFRQYQAETGNLQPHQWFE